ncbi:M56 family metallopeptidase, partial [Planctomycetota bacterium]
RSPRPTWKAALLFAWTAIVALQVGLIAIRRHSLTRQLSKSTPASNADQAQLDLLRKRLKIRRRVRLCRGDASVPLVTGVVKPLIILPWKTTSDGGSEAKLDHILLHELSHIKRCDLVWAWIPETTRILFFFHPVVYQISREAKLYREAVCDQTVVQAEGSAKAYAKTLMTFIQKSNGLRDDSESQNGLSISGLTRL